MQTMRARLKKALLPGAIALVASAGFILLGASGGWASACGPGTLDSYIALGSGGCTISTPDGDISFHDFGYSAASSLAVPVPATGITVTPDAAGFKFTSLWQASGSNAFTDSFINYSATGVDGTLLAGADLSIAGFGRTGTGSVTVAETIPDTPPAVKALLFVYDDPSVGTKSFDSATFAPVSDIPIVFKDIGVTSGTGPGLAALSGVFNHLIPVPEPTTFVLMGSALPSLLLLRRRSRVTAKS